MTPLDRHEIQWLPPLLRGLLALAVGAALALALAAPASADEWIELRDSGFDPSHATVDAGETLHFSSGTGQSWSVTDDAGLFDSGTLAPAGAYSMTLSVPGTHVYRSQSGVPHEARITVRARSLPGRDDDRALLRIPDLPFPPPDPDEVDVHRGFAVEASTMRIMVGFAEDATVAEANAALADADVTIIGGLPSVGMLLVSVPRQFESWDPFARLDHAIATLRAAPGVAYAAMSTGVSASAVPARTDDATAGRGNGWDWDDPFDRGNWGLVWSQFPEAWNVLESIRRKRPAVISGIVDAGFEAHPDLLPQLEIQPEICPQNGEDCVPLENKPSAHGNHVAGIIGAGFDNRPTEAGDGRSLGVSGANPVARMYGYPSRTERFDIFKPLRSATLVDQQLQLFDQILRSRPPELRVINYSMGAASFNGERWHDRYGTRLCGPGARDDDLPKLPTPHEDVCTPNNLDEWQREMANVGRAAAPIVREAARQGVTIVQAAGNEGATFCPAGSCQPIDAAARAEFAWVSRHWDEPGVGDAGLPNPVIVVQSIDNAGNPRSDTTFGGDIAAPGDRILSTVLGDGYDSMGGSSMAAPYVTGLISYLLADDPSLSIADVRRLVLGWANGRPASGAVDFTWTMPDRMNRDVTGDDMVDYLTQSWQIDPLRWKVDLDACDASVGGKPVGTYTWTVDGEVVGSTADCRFRWRPWREGTYSVTLTATAAEGEQQSVTKDVKVDDLLIVSVGDSIASGEGNPDIEFPGTRWQSQRCHRSAFAGPAQAARWLEAADTRTSVTLLHLACSGGRIEGDTEAGGALEVGFPGVGGLLTRYEGVTQHDTDSPCAQSRRTDPATCLPPQLDEAGELVAGRDVDALLVSIGANDMWFSKILKNCLIPLNDCSTNEAGNGLFQARIGLLPDRYARLAARIRERFRDLPPERVVLTQYPDLTTDETGEVNLSCGIASGISEAEQRWAADTVIPALNAQVANAAAAHGWTLAAGIPEDFRGHGYCSDDPWIVDITDTLGDQFDKEGAFHPNRRGHSAYARQIIESVRDVLALDTLTQARPPRDRAPRLNAYRPVAGNGPAARVVDVNDISKDGNRRVEREIAPDGTVTERDDEKSSHVDGELTAPDGRVDMRDLRRFRDAWLQRCLAESDGCPAAGDISLDGGDQHQKRDLNLDGCVTGDPRGCNAREHWYARFDFNGDRAIDPVQDWLVPWKADGTPAQGRADATRMSDLDVLASAWTGGTGAEGWEKADLPDMLRSADLQVHADAVLDAGAASAQLQVREKDGAPVGAERKLRRRDGFAVMTVPLASTTQEYELVATATTDKGAMSSVSAPFSLKYGEDRLVAVCPDLSLKAAPARVPADGTSTSIVTATLHPCHGREVAGKEVTFTLLEPGGGSLTAMAPTTDAQGRAQAVFDPGSETGTYTVKVSIDPGEGAEPLEAEVEIEVVPTITVRYVWRQTIEEWEETGSTRWQAFDPLMPDCTAPGMEYCIDSFRVGLESQTLGGVQRAGTLTGGGDRFTLTEEVSNSGAGSRANWTLSFPDGETEDGGKVAEWFVTDPQAYTDHAVEGLRAEDGADGIRLSGMQAIGDLPYHYALLGAQTDGTVAPIEVHDAKNALLLVPQRPSIRFAAQPDEDVIFGRAEDGFKQFQSCGRLEEDLQTQPGYYVAGASDYIPGALSVGRKTEYAAGDRPMPVGPGRLKVRYAFAAVVTYSGQPAPDPVLPDCSVAQPPDADFEITPAGDGPAKEGRQVAFRDRSTDPDNDIVERAWDFGDGATAAGTSAHHMFDDDGTYTVTLTVTDAEGNTDTATQELVVENEPPEAEIDDATALADGLRVRYRMLDPGTVDKQQLRWRLTSTNPAFPTSQGTDHAGVWSVGPYTGLPAGTYPVTLTVTDKDGAAASDDAVVVVTEEPPPPPPPPPGGSYVTCDPAVSLDAEEREFFDLVNAYREDNGLAPVGVSATLTRAAGRHADDMAAEDYMAHEGSDGSSPAERAWDAGYPRAAGVGENLAETETAWDALWAWRGSSTGHNENMLNPSWRAIGIARAKGGIWRWATSYGTAQDCPAVSPGLGDGGSQQALAADSDPEPFEATPTRAGVASYGAEPPRVSAAAAEPEPEPEPVAAEPEPVVSAAADDEPLYPPTVAVAVDQERPRAGRPVAVANRSRDAAGTPVGARLRFGDEAGDETVDLAPDEARSHSYPEEQWLEYYYMHLTAADGAGRSSELERRMPVDPVLPPYLDVNWSDQIAVAGRPYTVKVEVYDQNTWDPVPGLELTFTLGDRTVAAVTDADGLATASIRLLEAGGSQIIAIAFAGTDDYKPATEELSLDVMVNHPPVADAGGPYVAGEGGSLMLDGTGSTDEDPAWFDRIVAHDWDLDGDGDHDDAQGRLPAVLEGDELAERVCGGTCAAGTDYPVSLQVTDSHGDRGTDTTSLRFVADFDLLLGGETKTIVPGQSNSFAVTLIGSRSYDKPVTLSVAGLPPGVTASFSKNPVTPTDVSVLKLTGGSELENGTYPLRVSGTDGEITKEVSDELTVAFGLIPICYGKMAGVVTDKTTGEPVTGAGVSLSGASGVTDATGRYQLDRVPLGFNNAPVPYGLTASKGGYWPASGAGQAACGAVTRVDFQLLEIRTGTVRGRVIDKETREPLPDAFVRENCGTSCELVHADDDGRVEMHPRLATDNRARTWSGRADAPGYWYQDKGAQIAEDQPADVLYELVEKCSGTLDGGHVRYSSTNEPAVNAPVAVYITGSFRPDLVLSTDENGRFEIDRSVPLAHDNRPISYRIEITAPQAAPPGTRSATGYLRLSECGDVANEIFLLPTPQPNYGAIEGRVTDEETGAPMAGRTVTTCVSGCQYATTDAEGFYRFDRVHVGDDTQTRMWRQVNSEATGYYAGSANGYVDAGQTTTLDIKLLRKRQAALDATVVDSVTGAPIPGARLAPGGFCSTLCFATNREGEVHATGLALGHRNAPVGLNLTATAAGYWPQAKSTTLRADETATLAYELQPECEPARVSGTVVNAETQAPIHHAQVSGGVQWPAFTDAEGRFEIEGIKPSTGNNPRQVTLTASASGFHSQSKQITIFCGARIRVEFGSRTTKTGAIVGTVVDGDTSEPLAGTFVGTDFGATATTDADGRYRIDGVPLGDLNADREWSVLAHPAGYKPKTRRVTVTADTESRLDFTFTTANERPTAAGKTVTLDEDTNAEISVVGADPDGDTLTYHVMRWPEHGRLHGRLPDVTYEPDRDYHGPDRFEYLVNDGVASSEHATVDLGIRPVNDPPHAVEDRLDGEPEQTLRIPVADLLANDAEVDDEPKRITGVRSNHAEANVVLEDDEVVFTPPPGWASQTQYAFFAYTITDAAGASSTAFVYIRVDHGPAAPRCVDRSYTVRQGQSLQEAVACTDKNGDPLTYALVSGTVDLAADGTFTYTPPAGFVGPTSFRFRASDGALESDVATVTIDVRPDNDAPVCTDLTVEGDEDEAVEVSLSCTDTEGDQLQYELLGDPAHGTLEPIAGARYRYTPEAGWFGEDAFAYAAHDGHGRSEPARVAVTIHARPVDLNRPPATTDDALEIDEDTVLEVPAERLTANDADADGDALAVTAVGGAAHGAASLAGGTVRFAPDRDFHGPARFTYTVADGKGASATGAVAVDVSPVNDAPVAADDTATARQDEPVWLEPAALLVNDRDPDGDTLTVAAVGDPVNGTVALDAGNVRFSPSPGFQGVARFAYTVADGHGGTASATTTVQVDPTGSQLLLGCTDRAVVLEDVVPAGRRVKLLGVADPRLAGRPVELRFLATRKVVARATVGPDGRFAAKAPMPARRIRSTNRARYVASVDGEQSLALKLMRRMLVSHVRASGGKVTIRGRVVGPLAHRARDRVIEVQRRRSCKEMEQVASIRPRSDGRFRATVRAPAGEGAAVYRLRTKVARSRRNPKLFNTFTLPRAVDF